MLICSYNRINQTTTKNTSRGERPASPWRQNIGLGFSSYFNIVRPPNNQAMTRGQQIKLHTIVPVGTCTNVTANKKGENVHRRQIATLVGCHKILSIIDFHNAPIVQTCHRYYHHHHRDCHHHHHPSPHSDDEVAKESEMQDALPTGQERRDLQEMRTAAKMQLLRASKMLLRED